MRLLALSVLVTACAEPLRLDRAETLIEDAIARGECPGAVLLVGQGDEVLYRGAFGRRTGDAPLTPDTIFDMASLTKPVACATSVMKLIERGALKPSDRVVQYFPKFGANGKDVITVEHLLLHTGGLISDNALADYGDGPDPAWERICALKPETPPGTRFRYTDVGYIVLGRLVEKIDGRPLDRFARQEIFEPLGMRDTTYRPPPSWRPKIAPTEGSLHGTVHDPRAQALGGVAGHAGLFSTVDDLARYCRMLLGGPGVLAPQTVKMMIEPRPVPGGRRTYGFDVDTDYSSCRGLRFEKGVTFGHTGFTGTMLWIDPKNDCYAILLTSRLHPDGKGDVLPLRRAVMTAVAEALLGPEEGVTPGIDVLIRDDFKALEGRRIGLITNLTGRSRDGRRTIDWLKNSPRVTLVKIFSPEHGLFAKAEGEVANAKDEATGLPVLSLYGKTRRPTPAMLEGIDTIVFDVQDIGARFYTYVTTMGYAMEEAAKAKLRFVVLDRPNPLGPVGPDGPTADADKLGFICYRPIPVLHGMTTGELAGLFNAEIKGDLHVVKMEGWKRTMWWEETKLPWVNPSPNIRSPQQALLYPAVGLMEYANISVGRGTDTPFEVFGAPWLDGATLAARLNRERLPGLSFEAAEFTPTTSKHEGAKCGGVRVIVTDRTAVRPVRSGLAMARAVKELGAGKFEADRVLDMLGNAAAQKAWPEGDASSLWTKSLAEFERARKRHLLY